MKIHTFTGKAEKMKDEDLPRIGSQIGVGEDEIHAVLDVETRGGGFDRSGRLKMLFEPHIFYRELEDEQGSLRAAMNEGLAYKKWGTKRYPKDSYPALKKAMAINRRAALRSASWGLGQIMGFNSSLAGYDSAEEMVIDFMESEANQLKGMVNFIKNAGLDDEIRAHDWTGFARGYNGSQYAKHGYHLKLAKRFAFWQTKPDTPWTMDRVG